MKILAIRGKNLASLEGEFEIDFTQEPLRSAGIFAITGSTGAGKSTILDALCLSLFDQTPRSNIGESAFIQDVKDKVINQKDSRNILRRGCFDAYSEVDFLSLGGERFRARWMVKRARGKVDGAMQNSEVRLVNLDTTLEVGGGKKELLVHISELIGLTYEQFTRAVLLAQGDFSTFLKAKQTDKAELLEKLTGTDIYSRISMLIYEKSKNADRECQSLQERMQEVELLTDEDVQALLLEKQGLILLLESLRLKSGDLSDKLKWISQNDLLENSVAQARNIFAQIQQKIAGSQSRYDYLTKIESVQEIRDVYNDLKNLEGEEQKKRFLYTQNRDVYAQIEPKLQACCSQIEDLTMQLEQIENSAIAKDVLPRIDLVEGWITEAEKITKEGMKSTETLAKLEKELQDNAAFLVEQQQEWERLNLMLPAEIVKLRSGLEDGKPCPVCGSLHHPIQLVEVESMQEKELATSKQKVSAQIEALVAKIDSQKIDLTRLQVFIENSRDKYKQVAGKLEEALQRFPNWKVELQKGNLLKFLNIEVAANRKLLKNSQEQLLQKQQDKEKLIGAQGELKGGLEQIQAEITRLKEQKSDLRKRLDAWILNKGVGFSEEHLVDLFSKNTAWVQNERQDLHRLKEEETSALATLNERLLNLENHQASLLKVETETIDSLRTLLLDVNSQLEALTVRNVEIDVCLTTQSKGREKVKALKKEFEEKATLAENWKKLNDLFGSASGAKFKEIAQGYTLDILLAYANKHLQYLSPRYQLQRIANTLSLQVADLDMLGEVRTVHSLSGGESFLISLSLALGLSSLSSNRMKVESLFIDEGFGTLDMDMLRVAMDALERLQNQGRKIGVISHVAEMTERITTQVKVIKMSNGKSRVQIS